MLSTCIFSRLMQQLFTFLVVLLIVKVDGNLGDFRPPAVPLIVFSPQISVWSFTDNLTDSDTVHWGGFPLAFHGLIDIDNTETYRFLDTLPNNTQPLVQKKVIVQPWRTIYTFSTPTDTVELVLIFSQPISIDDPYTYITFNVRSLDQKLHNIRIYFDEGPTLGLNGIADKINWNRTEGNVTVLTIGGYEQIPFLVRGDAARNNWGYAHLISGNKSISTGHQACGDDLRQAFVSHQTMPNDDTRKPRRANDQIPTSAFVLNLEQVSSQSVFSFVVLLYDDVYSMIYFGEWQPPCWRAELDNNVTLLINESIAYYETNMADITDTNAMVINMFTDVGGEEYATLCSLVTRQVTGALTRTWSNQYNRSQLYMKEISTNGDISTVNVIYPSSTFFLLLHPEMLRDVLIPVLTYANNQTTTHYNLTWAPHHLGTWPVCDLLPDEQKQMPMEESANMLLMLAAIVQRVNNTDFLQPYWNLLEIWAQYLNSSLPDPGNQLCTDDFEGPSPHNCNLAVKGILVLGAYALLLNMTGQTQRAIVFMDQAQDYVHYWLKAARDQNNYRLQYDLPNTWSQKYNLVYQNILSLSLFPPEVAQLESAYYETEMLDYGIPLDSRSNVTKSDWMSWTAAYNDDPQQQNAIFSKLYKFANESKDRVPFSDFYDAATGHVVGFRARPVMGALFARALLNSSIATNMTIKTKISSKRHGQVNKCNI